MGAFKDYLQNVNEPERKELERIIGVVKKFVPEAIEGYSYGFPAFKYNGRPLFGFGVRADDTISIYPFDPRVIADLGPDLVNFKKSKGVIWCSVSNPLPENLIVLILTSRLEYLTKK